MFTSPQNLSMDLFISMSLYICMDTLLFVSIYHDGFFLGARSDHIWPRVLRILIGNPAFLSILL